MTILHLPAKDPIARQYAGVAAKMDTKQRSATRRKNVRYSRVRMQLAAENARGIEKRCENLKHETITTQHESL